MESAIRTHHSQTMSNISGCIYQLHIYKFGIGTTIEIDGIYEEGAEIDCVACAVKWLVGNEIQLLLHTTCGVVVDETIGHKTRKVYRRRCLISLTQSLCPCYNRHKHKSP